MAAKPQHLPDAMPEIDHPTLLVVCDTHHCTFIDVGNHTLLVRNTVVSTEPSYSDNEGHYQSPGAGGKGGVMGGLNDPNPTEKHRLRAFANDVTRHMAHVVQEQGIRQVYLSAPGKFLSALKDHLTPALKKLVAETLDGNFIQEPPRDVLLRFRPDLKDSLNNLREQENYSAKKHLPKKAKK